MHIEALDHLYRTVKQPRLRTRAHMFFLGVAQGLKVPQFAGIMRERQATVCRWCERYRAEGLHSLQDARTPWPPLRGDRGLAGRVVRRRAVGAAVLADRQPMAQPH